MEFIEELVQDHATFTEPYKHQVSFIQVETFSPPQWSHFLIFLLLCLLEKYSMKKNNLCGSTPTSCAMPRLIICCVLCQHKTHCISCPTYTPAYLRCFYYFQYLIIKCHKHIPQYRCFILEMCLILMSAAWMSIKSITITIP